MTSKKLLLAGLIAALGLAGTSQAAVIHVTPKLRAVLASDFSSLDPATHPVDALPANAGGTYILQVDFLMTIDSLQAGQLGFGNAAVNVGITGGAQAAAFPGWQADGWTVDRNGAGPGGTVPKWAGNADAGQISTDLQNILVETAPRDFFTGDNTTDPRRSLGVAPYNNSNKDALDQAVTPWTDGEYFGTVFVEISGDAGTSGAVSAFVSEGSAYNADLLLSAVGVTGGAAQGLNFQVVPEPSTFALLGLGGALLAFARKRR